MTSANGWLTLDDWCAKYGERKNTVHKRVTDGVWERGVHYSAPDGGVGFVNEARGVQWLADRSKLPAA